MILLRVRWARGWTHPARFSSPSGCWGITLGDAMIALMMFVVSAKLLYRRFLPQVLDGLAGLRGRVRPPS